jgi:uncharacterized protein (DUF362 family)
MFKRRGIAYAATTLEPRPKKNIATACGLAVANNSDPATATRAAVNALGGMKLFVKRGDTVVVKPNIGWDRTPELAGNTNPAVVEILVRMSFEAGAKFVKVFDYTCNDARRTYENSGIAAAARKAGAMVFFVDDWKFFPGKFPAGAMMADWPMYRDGVACDCFINAPVAKHHRLTDVTLSIKNLMGVCGSGRGEMHQNIAPKLAEVLAFMRPELTVIDASRILLRNGPTGGNMADVKKMDTVIASADAVLADSYAATLFGHKPAEIGYIKAAADQKLGSMDLAAANIRKVTA